MPQPKDKDWLNGYKIKAPTRDPPQTKGHMHSESEGMEKAISCKLRPKKKE